MGLQVYKWLFEEHRPYKTYSKIRKDLNMQKLSMRVLKRQIIQQVMMNCTRVQALQIHAGLLFTDISGCTDE